MDDLEANQNKGNWGRWEISMSGRLEYRDETRSAKHRSFLHKPDKQVLLAGGFHSYSGGKPPKAFRLRPERS
jgi:hypothetical protein